MPLQNRVTPHGEIVAIDARGTFMGNRGGRFHTDKRELATSRWKSKAWIICLLSFKGWHREVMTPRSYTELFFLDEATALAAGHRPCFECRRKDAEQFMGLWRGLDAAHEADRAGDLDRVLHLQRLGPKRTKRTAVMDADALPDGAMVDMDGEAWLKAGGALIAWSPEGYYAVRELPAGGKIRALTPPAILSILAAGYRPFVHESVGRFLEGDDLAALRPCGPENSHD